MKASRNSLAATMTLRQHVAIAAMNGLLRNQELSNGLVWFGASENEGGIAFDNAKDRIAKVAVVMADTLLAELAK